MKIISSQAFASCKDLTDVYCLAEEVPRTSSDAFEESYIEYATLHVPTVSIEAYEVVEPWENFKEIKLLTDEDIPVTPDPEKCATPTIAFVDGKLTFSCETEGVEYVSEITCSDAKKHYETEIPLACTYQVSVYAMKAGYLNSEVATMAIDLRAGGVKGDVNGDGVVNVTDVTNTINIILGKK